jgi:hypothetical protein
LKKNNIEKIGKRFVNDIVKKYLKFDIDEGYMLYDMSNDLIEIFHSEEDARRYIEDNEEIWVDTLPLNRK